MNTLPQTQTVSGIAGHELSFTIETDAEFTASGNTVRFVAADENLRIVLSTDESAPSVVIDATNGVSVTIQSGATSDLRGTYRWQCEAESDEGTTRTLARGFLTIKRNLIASAS